MSNIWFIADTHFGDEGVLKQRSIFANINQHDEFLMNVWTTFIRDGDIVYCIGDMGTPSNSSMSRLPGHKHLVIGNREEGGYTTQGRDKLTTRHLTALGDVYASVRAYNSIYNKFMCSHLPLHPETIYDGFLNVHGHIHAKTVEEALNNRQMSDLHYNVGVDVTNFEPVSFEELLQVHETKFGTIGE